MNNHLLKYELELLVKGKEFIAGLDEVGRGALAGPMVVGAAIINPNHIRNYDVIVQEFKDYLEVKDSKLISPKKREKLSEFLKNIVLDYAVYEIPNTQIDEIGISKCTQVGFFSVIKKLKLKPNHVLTDAFEIKAIAKESQTNIIGGDNKSISIAAASIIAKVYRDNLMTNLSASYSVYEFERHKGYGTKIHLERIRELGVSDLHRKTFCKL